MKKSDSYAQTSILNELLLIYTTRDLADAVSEFLTSKDVDLSVYDTHSDGIIFRKKKDGMITDDAIIKAFSKATKQLIEDTEGSENDIKDIINDNYEFEYSKKYMSEEFFANILSIRRSGRLIYIEIDIQ